MLHLSENQCDFFKLKLLSYGHTDGKWKRKRQVQSNFAFAFTFTFAGSKWYWYKSIWSLQVTSLSFYFSRSLSLGVNMPLHCFWGSLLVIFACWFLQVCDAALQRFELVPYADKTVKTYSGGTKRKLSVALALLGEPDLILLVRHKIHCPNRLYCQIFSLKVFMKFA